MKKILLFSVLMLSLSLANTNKYTDKVVSLCLNKDDTKVQGRLLPTNPFQVVRTEGNKVLLRISGYVNPAAPSVLYFNNSQRIIVAAFSKNAPLKFKSKAAGTATRWGRATIEVWADKQDFASSDKEMLSRARSLYADNCGICHTVHKENEFTANQWPAQFRSMADRTGIAKEDRWLVIEYLQKNARDFKKGK